MCLIMIFGPKKNVYTLDLSSTGKGFIKSSLQTAKATTLDCIEVAEEARREEMNVILITET